MSDDKYTQRLESLFSNTERVPPDPEPPATPPETPDAEAMQARLAEIEAAAAEARRQAEARHWPDELLKALVLQALAFQAQRENEQALTPLLDHIQTAAFRLELNSLAGYNSAHSGEQINL